MSNLANRVRRLVAAMLVGCLALILAQTASGHAFAPALLQLTEVESGSINVRWKQPASRVSGSALRPVLPASCSGVGAANVQVEGTGVVAHWTIECPGGLLGEKIGVEGLAGSGANALVRVVLADGRSMRDILTPDDPVFEIPLRENRLAVVQSYGALGVEHILTGYDHLLFVLGLLLLVGRGGQLLWTVTAFTIGHSITLALAALGLVHVPQQPVEAAIALSIFVLAVEIARRSAGARRTLLQNRLGVMAGLFGLLHGLGFAGALSEIGLPQVDIPLTLFAFNVGIEIGQLLFIGVLLGVWTLIDQLRISLPESSRLVPAYGIGCLASFWFIERSWNAFAVWQVGAS